MSGITIPDNTIAISPTGSHLYGLSTPESDHDLLVITRGKMLKEKQVMCGEIDLRITSLDLFHRRIMEGIPLEVDVLRGGKLFYMDNNYKPFLNGMRFSSIAYAKRALKHMRSDARNSYRDRERNPRRSYKSLVTAVRSHWLVRRVLEDGQNYTPVFTEEDKYWFLYTVRTLHTEMLTHSEKSFESFLDIMLPDDLRYPIASKYGILK